MTRYTWFLSPLYNIKVNADPILIKKTYTHTNYIFSSKQFY